MSGLSCSVRYEDSEFVDEKTGAVRPYVAFYLTLPSGFEIRVKTADTTSKNLLVSAIMAAEKSSAK